MSAQTVTMRDPHGVATEVKIEDVAAAEAAGFKVEAPSARVERLSEDALAAEYGGTADQLAAGITGLARGATLGLSDVATSILGSEGDVEAIRNLRKYNPKTSLATEILGGAVPSIASGGTGTLGSLARATPTGALSARATALTGELAGTAGAGRYVAGTAAGTAIEGAVQNVGAYVSDVALEDKKLSAEGFLASAGQGALWGGVAGGALAGVERGTIAARRLFPRSVADGREAVDLIEQKFLTSADDSLKVGDELEKVARSTADDLRIRGLELNLERERIRQATDLSPAAKIRLKEIDVERAKLSAARKQLRATQNAERAAQALPDIPPEVQALSPPPLDEAAVVPTGPPAAPQGQIDDLTIAAQNSAHEAGLLADDAVKSGEEAAARLTAKVEDYATRKQAVKDWIAKYQPGAKSKYTSTLTGESPGGAPMRTDRTRIMPDGGVEFEAYAGDRVYARESVLGAGAKAELPRGFDYGPPGPDAPVRRGLPAPGEAFDENAIYVAKAGDFKRAGMRAGDDSGFAQNRVDSIKSAWSKDRKLDPIKAGFDENGDLVIIDGRHRLAAAADDQEIAVRLHPFSDEPGQAMGANGPSSRYASAASGRRPRSAAEIEPASKTADIGGRSVRFEIVPDKAIGREAPKAFEIKAYRTLSDGEEVEFATGRFVPDGDGDLFPRSVQVEPGMQRKGVASRMYEMAEEASGRRMIPSDAQTPQGEAFSKAFRSRRDSKAAAMSGGDLDAAYDDLIERASNAADGAEMQALAREAGAIEDQIMDRVAARGGREADEIAKIRAKRAEYNWTSADVAARRAEKLGVAKATPDATSSSAARAAREDLEVYDRGLRRQQFTGKKTAGEVADEILQSAREVAAPQQSPRQPSGLGRFIDDADEAIRVVGEFERAQYELAQELGAAAPLPVQQQAAAYAQALDDQARKASGQMAAAADDAVRARSLPSTDEAKRSMEIITLPKAPPVAESKAAGRFADAAGMLELINSMGDVPFLPDARDLPVIGPVLAMYLKYRGLKAVYHRLGGRVPATANAKIAARSAEIRDKAATIVDGILEGTGKAAKAARPAAAASGPRVLDALKHSLYPDGEERKEAKTAAEATKARVAELSAVAGNPEAARDAIRRQIGSTDPDMVEAVVEATMRKLEYLQKHAPKQPPQGLFAARAWTPSRDEMERFARRVRAAEDPMSVLHDLERGTITSEAADTLREVYPALFTEVQTRLLTRAADLQAKLPYQRRIHLSLLFDAPLDPSLLPQNVAALQQVNSPQAATEQAAGPVAGQPPASSVAAPVNLSRLYETPEMRRAARR